MSPLDECGQPEQLVSNHRAEFYLWALLGGDLA